MRMTVPFYFTKKTFWVFWTVFKCPQPLRYISERGKHPRSFEQYFLIPYLFDDAPSYHHHHHLLLGTFSLFKIPTRCAVLCHLFLFQLRAVPRNSEGYILAAARAGKYILSSNVPITNCFWLQAKSDKLTLKLFQEKKSLCRMHDFYTFRACAADIVIVFG